MTIFKVLKVSINRFIGTFTKEKLALACIYEDVCEETPYEKNSLFDGERFHFAFSGRCLHGKPRREFYRKYSMYLMYSQEFDYSLEHLKKYKYVIIYSQDKYAGIEYDDHRGPNYDPCKDKYKYQYEQKSEEERDTYEDEKRSGEDKKSKDESSTISSCDGEKLAMIKSDLKVDQKIYDSPICLDFCTIFPSRVPEEVQDLFLRGRCI